jgi:hypothetical protein
VQQYGAHEAVAPTIHAIVISVVESLTSFQTAGGWGAVHFHGCLPPAASGMHSVNRSRGWRPHGGRDVVLGLMVGRKIIDGDDFSVRAHHASAIVDVPARAALKRFSATPQPVNSKQLIQFHSHRRLQKAWRRKAVTNEARKSFAPTIRKNYPPCSRRIRAPYRGFESFTRHQFLG